MLRAGAIACAAVLAITAGGCAVRDGSATGIIPHDYQLTAAQHRAWLPLRDAWFSGTYGACLKRYRLAMSCAGCTHAYLRVVLTIGRDGTLADARIIKTALCSHADAAGIASCFLEHFRGVIFPPALRGLRFETMLGTGLSC